MVQFVIGLVIAVILVVAVAIPVTTGMNTSSLSATALVIYNLIPLALVVGLLVVAFSWATKQM